MYEVGRPRRLTVEEAQAKESQWQDFGAPGGLHGTPLHPAFTSTSPHLRHAPRSPHLPPTATHCPAARFADARLQRSGRCHESEILKALQREMPQFRREGALDGNTLRQLVRNWHPDADRSSNGFYKGISLVAGGGADIAPRAASSTGSASSVDQY